MSFRQQLGRSVVQARAEKQRLLQVWVAETKQKFIQECEAAAQKEQLCCTMEVRGPEDLINRGVSCDLLLEKLRGIMAELGFEDDSVSPFEKKEVWKSGYGCAFLPHASLTATWIEDDAASASPERSLKTKGGTYRTCPICYEHRPAVVLVPCGHVVCRDCQRCKNLRQCPICREVITSASRGLFME